MVGVEVLVFGALNQQFLPQKIQTRGAPFSEALNSQVRSISMGPKAFYGDSRDSLGYI